MYRPGPQVFVAIPATARPELRDVIQQTLADLGGDMKSAELATPEKLTQRIQDLVRESDFVIADVTGTNPNVMIEVGMALGMGKRLLLLSEGRSAELPSELAAHQVAVYEADDVDGVRKYLRLWLRDAMAESTQSSP